MAHPLDGGPYGGAVGGNPLDREGEPPIKCPRCKKANFHAFTNTYGLIRRCKECGNEWSGGSANASANPDWRYGVPLPGTPAPYDDLPVTQYTGASFRDPSKNSGGDE